MAIILPCLFPCGAPLGWTKIGFPQASGCITYNSRHLRCNSRYLTYYIGYVIYKMIFCIFIYWIWYSIRANWIKLIAYGIIALPSITCIPDLRRYVHTQRRTCTFRHLLFMLIMIWISIFILISVWILISPPHPPHAGAARRGAGGSIGCGRWGDIDIHIDINMNIDIHIIITMNRQYRYPQALLTASSNICVVVFVRHVFFSKVRFNHSLPNIVNIWSIFDYLY